MLAALLDSGKTLLADGATGTNLFAMGLAAGEAPEAWNIEHPDRVRQLHQGFVDAGSDIILTNTFGGNARRLMLHGLQDRAREINRIAAQIARSVADKAGRPVVVAGSVGPTGDLFEPLGVLTEELAIEVFTEQMTGLKEGGADVAWIETMSSLEEIKAAATAAGRVGIPYTFTASFDTAGRTMMGITPAALVEFAKELRPRADGDWRELRCRGIGPRDERPAHECERGGDPAHCQGERRSTAVHRRADPLFGHAGAHGQLRGHRGGLGRAHHRRVLRHDGRAHGGHA
jgi:5-methyltetrahydrofolate--homocysteine methyltransferase